MNKNLQILGLLLLLFFTKSFSQNLTKVNLKGTVTDTTAEKMAFAYVMLLNPADSTMLNYTRADETGVFEFKNIKNSKYLLKVSYINYLPLSIIVGPFIEENIKLERVKIKPISKELMEVVVRTARAPLTIRGDTIEYDARAFKVLEGSTVEDLLRRLPGLEVDADGNIKAQGKDVKRVLVDGKTFFGDDPKAATKNLGAETISKVQVYNDKSDQAKLTGIDDGKKEKAINLELKEEFKKGKFGKLTAAAGNESRWAAKGNYNIFNKNEQFSVIGYGNNINQTGVNWDDYGEFKGNSQFQFDNGDFGFNSNSGGRYYYSDGEEGINNFDGRGFTKNSGADINYNFDNKKAKFSTSYFYNQTKLNLNTIALRQTFLQNGSFFNNDTTSQNNFLGNHSIGTRFEKMIDSSNTIIAKANIRIGANDKLNSSIQSLSKIENTTDNLLNLNNNFQSNSLRISSTVIYRYKFKKNKARNFAASIGYNMNKNTNDEAINSINKFYNATNIVDQIRASDLLNTTDLNTNQLKASLSYLHPVNKKVFWESFYNFSNDENNTFRDSKNVLESGRRIDSLSSFFENNILYNRIGTSMRYSHEGKNISIGLAAVQFGLNGETYLDRSSAILTKINKTYSGFVPNIESTFEFNNTYLNLNYNFGLNAPNLNDLQPIINNSNPFYITEGNPNLSPEKMHDLGVSIYKFDPKTMAYFNIYYSYNYFNSQIVYNQSTNDKFVTYTKPENLGGGNRNTIYLGGSYPIIKTKATLRVNGNIYSNSNPNKINGVLNTTKSVGNNIGVTLNLTPSSKFFMDLSSRFGKQKIRYSIQANQNQNIITTTYDATIKWNFVKNMFFESNFQNNIYKNDRLNFNQTMPIWNASIRKLFLKENKLEMRLAAFDFLNKRVGINQSGTANYVYNEISPTLARYYMLSLTYNMRGHEGKLKKNEMF
jgi:Outer membrane protein beta-barrel family